jgi:hypothetical protein
MSRCLRLALVVSASVAGCVSVKRVPADAVIEPSQRATIRPDFGAELNLVSIDGQPADSMASRLLYVYSFGASRSVYEVSAGSHEIVTASGPSNRCTMHFIAKGGIEYWILTEPNGESVISDDQSDTSALHRQASCP